MAKAMWRMRDGTEIAIKDMSDDHLANVAKMLLRRASNLHLSRALEMTQRLAFCNGEMAQDAIESEITAFQEISPDQYVKENWSPIFNACKRRGLKLENANG